MGKEKAGWDVCGSTEPQARHIRLADQEAADSAKTIRLIMVLLFNSLDWLDLLTVKLSSG